MMAGRVIRLVERRARLARLRREDLDYLIAWHHTHIDVQPTHDRGVYRLMPRGHVGAIEAPGCRFEIAPKIPLPNLLHLLDPDDALALRPDSPGAASGGLVELLAGRFATLLAERVAAGLRSRYVEREEVLPHLRGRLDVAAQIREAATDRLHCRYEDFSPDAPWNRQVKAVAELLFASPLPGDDVRAVVRYSLPALAGVGDEPASDLALAVLVEDPRLAEYRPLLEISRLLCSALTPGGRCPSFLIDLERVFERYVTRGLQRALARSDIAVEAQMSSVIHESVAGDQPTLALRPDVTLRQGGRVVTVVDAKWKRLPPAPEAADLHQALAYAGALNARHVVLVYPGGRTCCWDYRLTGSPIRLGLHRLRVRGTRDDCLRVMARWASSLAAS